MSQPENAPAPAPPPARHYTGGLIAMMVVGIILLLPGLCSLLFFLGMLPELNAKSFSDPIAQMIFTLWFFCFLASSGGIALIVVARRRAGAPP